MISGVAPSPPPSRKTCLSRVERIAGLGLVLLRSCSGGPGHLGGGQRQLSPFFKTPSASPLCRSVWSGAAWRAFEKVEGETLQRFCGSPGRQGPSRLPQKTEDVQEINELSRP